MSKSATRILILAAGATALAAVCIATPASAVSQSTHIKKHLKNHHWVQRGPVLAERSRQARNYPTRQAWSGGRAYGAAGCFRAVDCAQWPPSVEQDPDRKIAGDGM
jgi:hypothetical protein